MNFTIFGFRLHFCQVIWGFEKGKYLDHFFEESFCIQFGVESTNFHFRGITASNLENIFGRHALVAIFYVSNFRIICQEFCRNIDYSSESIDIILYWSKGKYFRIHSLLNWSTIERMRKIVNHCLAFNENYSLRMSGEQFISLWCATTSLSTSWRKSKKGMQRRRDAVIKWSVMKGKGHGRQLNNFINDISRVNTALK